MLLVTFAVGSDNECQDFEDGERKSRGYFKDRLEDGKECGKPGGMAVRTHCHQIPRGRKVKGNTILTATGFPSFCAGLHSRLDFRSASTAFSGIFILFSKTSQYFHSEFFQ